MGRFWIAAASCASLFVGCQSAPSSPPAQPSAASANQADSESTAGAAILDEVEPAGSSAAPPPAATNEPSPAAPQPLMTARAAAMRVAAMPALIDARERREVLLHAAMFRAAMDSNIAGYTTHFLLEPAPESSIAPMSIDLAEFRLRVLARLDRPIITAAWNPRPGDRSEWTFPGTRELVTRLSIRINERIDDQATVKGEISDTTHSIGSSRQGVTATWDGERWNVERDRVRIVW